MKFNVNRDDRCIVFVGGIQGIRGFREHGVFTSVLVVTNTKNKLVKWGTRN